MRRYGPLGIGTLCGMYIENKVYYSNHLLDKHVQLHEKLNPLRAPEGSVLKPPKM